MAPWLEGGIKKGFGSEVVAKGELEGHWGEKNSTPSDLQEASMG